MTIIHRSRTIVLATLFYVHGAMATACLADDNQEARAFIQALGDRIIAVLRSDNLSAEDRRAQLSAVFVDAVDLDTVGRYVLGRYWRTADNAQRAEYQALFRSYAVNLYANRFSDYRGETFVVTQAKPAPKDTAIVFTQIQRPEGPPVAMDFRVSGWSGEMLIVDVIVEGVSLVATKRSEFATIIGRSGMNGLLAGLRQQSAETESSG